MLAFCTIILATLAAAHPIAKREVPQEHSHEKYVVAVRALLSGGENPLNLGDPVFSLLGDAAAAKGAGDVTNLACLQQAVADQAFTNAKANNDVDGMTNALVFRAVERNTAKVGQASALCNETAANPEIAALSQHQDPASDGAAATNKAITLELAKQIASVGGDTSLALDSGTFAPGDVSDSTGAGNTCDNQDDPEGCIFTQKLLVADATQAEIDAAAGGAGGAGGAAKSAAKVAAKGANVAAKNAGAAANKKANSNKRQAGGNLQTFTGTLGATAPAVTASGAEFAVAGNASFKEQANALIRSCDVQFNQCANAANGSGNSGAVTVSACSAQKDQCDALAK